MAGDVEIGKAEAGFGGFGVFVPIRSGCYLEGDFSLDREGAVLERLRINHARNFFEPPIHVVMGMIAISSSGNLHVRHARVCLRQ